ncbi:MAG: hypothetical protein IPM50_09360 [Acidobacteriota bacterium]|nr:MAG: hypothetical protein IPM50_09360 [Acidobacteriota bacterium]
MSNDNNTDLKSTPSIDIAAVAGRVEALDRLFHVVCETLVKNGAIDNDDLFNTVRYLNSNFKEIMDANDRVLAADRVTLDCFRAFAEMLDDINETAGEISELSETQIPGAVRLNDNSARRLEMVAGIDHANQILAAIGVPMPDAADLDEIHIRICGSTAHG